MDPYALAPDGSARDPRAFQEALREDAAKMAQLEKVSHYRPSCPVGPRGGDRSTLCAAPGALQSAVSSSSTAKIHSEGL
jgi:hypothetical protein